MLASLCFAECGLSAREDCQYATMENDIQKHWDQAYAEKDESRLSWHQDDPAVSLELSALAGVTTSSSVIDIGGGRSRFAASLSKKGLTDICVLDISAVALEMARKALGDSGKTIDFIAADVTSWTPGRTYDLWHDRAVFHFLVSDRDQTAYIDRMTQAITPGGHAIIATFDLDGPEKCSGLPVVRYSPQSLSDRLGRKFTPITARHSSHETPWGTAQSFQFSLFRKDA